MFYHDSEAASLDTSQKATFLQTVHKTASLEPHPIETEKQEAILKYF